MKAARPFSRPVGGPEGAKEKVILGAWQLAAVGWNLGPTDITMAPLVLVVLSLSLALDFMPSQSLPMTTNCGCPITQPRDVRNF